MLHPPDTSPHPLSWLPNALTMARVALAPGILGCLIVAAMAEHHNATASASSPWTNPWTTMALISLIIAGAFDFLDGKLARAWGVESAFGQFWDPIADKLVVGAALIGVSVLEPMAVPAALVIMGRDGAITWLRWRKTPTADGSAASIAAPSMLAKWKTALEFVALIALLAALARPGVFGGWDAWVSWGGWPTGPGLVALYIAAVLSAWTGWAYVRMVEKPGAL